MCWVRTPFKMRGKWKCVLNEASMIYIWVSWRASCTKSYSSLVKSPKKLFLWYSTHRNLSNDIRHMTIWAVWCIDILQYVVHSTKSTSSIMKIFFCIYQQITQHYLGVYQIGYIHCKFQTLSFQMTPILSWSSSYYWTILLLLLSQLGGACCRYIPF